jgi:hypothetical protein
MKKYIPYIIAFICVLSIAYISGRCSRQKEVSLNLANLAVARDSIHTYQITVDGLEMKVSDKDAIILTQKDAIEAGILENERLKALHIKTVIANAELSGTIRMLRDSLKLPPEIRFITVKDTNGNFLAVRIPYRWQYSDPYINLITGINENKTGFFDLSVPVTGEVTIGYKKAGFLKTTPVGIFTTLNPYMKVNDMSVLIVTDKKKFYQKTWFHLAAGAAIGIGVTKLVK